MAGAESGGVSLGDEGASLGACGVSECEGACAPAPQPPPPPPPPGLELQREFFCEKLLMNFLLFFGKKRGELKKSGFLYFQFLCRCTHATIRFRDHLYCPRGRWRSFFLNFLGIWNT